MTIKAGGECKQQMSLIMLWVNCEVSIVVRTSVKCIILENLLTIVSIALYPCVVLALVKENDNGSSGMMLTVMLVHE